MQIMLGSGLVFVEVGVQFNNFHQIYFTVTNISAILVQHCEEGTVLVAGMKI